VLEDVWASLLLGTQLLETDGLPLQIREALRGCSFHLVVLLAVEGDCAYTQLRGCLRHRGAESELRFCLAELADYLLRGVSVAYRVSSLCPFWTVGLS
jgi:hypothetical protein